MLHHQRTIPAKARSMSDRFFLGWENGKDKEFWWNWVHVKFCWICSIWYLLLEKLFQFERKKMLAPIQIIQHDNFIFLKDPTLKKTSNHCCQVYETGFKVTWQRCLWNVLETLQLCFLFSSSHQWNRLGSLLQKWKPSESKLTECRFIFFSISVLFLQLMRGYLWDSGRNYVQVMQVNFEIWTKPVSVECLLQ